MMIHKVAAMIGRIQFIHCPTLLSREYALICDARKDGVGVEDRLGNDLVSHADASSRFRLLRVD